MKKAELEKIAQGILEKNPSKDAVYMTKDGQAFFNKDAAANHKKGRGYKEVYDFFRSGVPSPQASADAFEALNH